MSFMGSKPPRPDAGAISPLTEALRPSIKLTKGESSQARRLLRCGFPTADIAGMLGVAEEVVRLAVATTRTNKTNASRGTLNVTLAAQSFVMAERQSNEAVWETTDRLFEELVDLRGSHLPWQPSI